MKHIALIMLLFLKIIYKDIKIFFGSSQITHMIMPCMKIIVRQRLDEWMNGQVTNPNENESSSSMEGQTNLTKKSPYQFSLALDMLTNFVNEHLNSSLWDEMVQGLDVNLTKSFKPIVTGLSNHFTSSSSSPPSQQQEDVLSSIVSPVANKSVYDIGIGGLRRNSAIPRQLYPLISSVLLSNYKPNGNLAWGIDNTV